MDKKSLIERIYLSGEDSCQSQYSINTFPTPLPNDLDLRIGYEFIPVFIINDTFISKIKNFLFNKKEIKIKTRLDKEWKIYNYFKNNRKLNFKCSSINSDAVTMTRIENHCINYHNCNLKKIEFNKFDHSSGDPIYLILTYSYKRVEVIV